LTTTKKMSPAAFVAYKKRVRPFWSILIFITLGSMVAFAFSLLGVGLDPSTALFTVLASGALWATFITSYREVKKSVG